MKTTQMIARLRKSGIRKKKYVLAEVKVPRWQLIDINPLHWA